MRFGNIAKDGSSCLLPNGVTLQANTEYAGKAAEDLIRQYRGLCAMFGKGILEGDEEARALASKVHDLDLRPRSAGAAVADMQEAAHIEHVKRVVTMRNSGGSEADRLRNLQVEGELAEARQRAEAEASKAKAPEGPPVEQEADKMARALAEQAAKEAVADKADAKKKNK